MERNINDSYACARKQLAVIETKWHDWAVNSTMSNIMHNCPLALKSRHERDYSYWYESIFSDIKYVIVMHVVSYVYYANLPVNRCIKIFCIISVRKFQKRHKEFFSYPANSYQYVYFYWKGN